MFGLCLLSGSIGVLLLWAVVWIPLAMTLKINIEAAALGQSHANQTQGKINVGGAVITISNTDSGSADLAVGMSMGES